MSVSGGVGEALLGHKALRSEKFRIEALFDNDPSKIGTEICGIPCYNSEDMTEVLREKDIEVIILTVPAGAAQISADRAVAAGTVKGIFVLCHHFCFSSRGCPCLQGGYLCRT